MTWERALEADARLAAKNALLVRAALRQQIDAERAYQGYLSTTPDTTLTLPQQRVRARAWAIINIRPNLEPLKAVVEKMWGQAYVLGDLAAGEAIEEAKEAQKADTTTKIDWSKWKPGDEASSIFIRKPGALKLLQAQAGFTWKGFSDTTLNDLGNSIGEAIYLGLDAKRSAKNIINHVASPARALTIAITEQNRAISQATLVRYREAGLQQMEWLVFDPCKICAQNANQIMEIGRPFASGDTKPPAHPNCRCALAPVIPGFDEPIPGATVIAPPTPAPVGIPDVPAPVEPVPARVIVTGEFVPGQWAILTKEERRQRVLDKYTRLNPGKDPSVLAELIDADSRVIPQADRSLVKKGIVYQNGPIEVQFYSAGASLPLKVQKQLLKDVEEMQINNPRSKMTIHVASNAGNAYGSALLGDAQIWLKPSTVEMDLPNKQELGHKMPVITEVPGRRYTLAHEWGHTLDEGGSFTRTESIQSATTKKIIEDLKKEYEGKAFRSAYSGENTKEFYAEMFAEFYLTNGQTKNALVQAMAKEFLWKAPAAPITAAPPVYAAYVPAKHKLDFFTKEKSNSFYAVKANGEIDYGSYNRDGQNLYLKNILEEQGFNGKPRVVSPEEFQKFVDQGSIPLYRGIAAETPEKVDDYVKQLFEGEDPFVGKGMFGDGTYYANKKEIGLKFSKEDRQGNAIEFGKVTEAVINPQAKVIDQEDLSKLMRKWYDDVPDHYDWAQDFNGDYSVFAAANGYDAIRIRNPRTSWNPDDPAVDGDYYIILNRTALIVKEMP